MNHRLKLVTAVAGALGFVVSATSAAPVFAHTIYPGALMTDTYHTESGQKSYVKPAPAFYTTLGKDWALIAKAKAKFSGIRAKIQALKATATLVWARHASTKRYWVTATPAPHGA